MKEKILTRVKKTGIVAAFLGVNAVLGWLGSNIDFDNSRWLPDENPHKQNKNYLYEEFDKGEDLVAAIDLKKSFFSQGVIDDLNSLTEKIEEIDKVIEVKSPLNSTTIIQTNNELKIITFGDALEEGTLPDIKAYKKRFINSEYFGRLLSKDYTVFSIIIKIDAPLSGKNFHTRKQILQVTRKLLKNYPEFSNYNFAGEVELNYQLDQSSRDDLSVLLPTTALLIIILLFFIFRSFWKATLITLTAVSSLMTVFAVGAVQGHSITVIGMSLPVLILVIAIADAIHIMTRWQKLGASIQNPTELLRKTVSQTWAPCLMTTITTAVGFGTFYFSELVPLEYFGLDSAVSIFLAYCIIMSTMWSGLYLAGNTSDRKKNISSDKQTLTILLQRLCHTSFNHSGKIMGSTILIFGLSVFFLKDAYTETNFLDVFFKKNSQTYRAFDYVDEYLGGTGAVDIIFKGNEEDAFKSPKMLQELRDIEKSMQVHELVNHVQSYLNPIRLIHKEFRKNKNGLPKTEQELAQEILFLEFSRGAEKNDVLSPYIDFNYQNSRMHLQTPNLNSTLSRKVKLFIQEQMSRFDLDYVITGSSVYFETLSQYVIDTQFISIFITTLFIWILFIWSFGFKLGSLGMIPNVLPIVTVMGLISALGIPFDFATVLIASVSFGLCVDDAIHFVHYYKLTLERGLPFERSMEETIKALGRPLVYTTVLFCIGFSVLLTSDMMILIKFGAFTLISLVLALLSNLLVLPAFLRRFSA